MEWTRTKGNTHQVVILGDFAQWFEQNLHSVQKLRIIRSGLKPEPGAWERSLLKSEMTKEFWRPTEEMIMAEEERLIEVRHRHKMATLHTPPRRRKADNFRVVR